MPPRVLNRRQAKGDPEREVWIARPSRWGNPFSHLPGTLAVHKVETREEAIQAYAEWILDQKELMDALPELEGKDLVCWCKPSPCHGDVLLRLANPVEPEERVEQGELW